MRDFEVRATSLSRDRLPEIFQGSLPPKDHVSFAELVRKVRPDHELTAVWDPASEQLNLLPHLIIGSREALNDLCAWAKAYMAGVGPLSGLMRLARPDQLRALESLSESVETIDIDVAGQQVAIVFAEVAARSRESAPDRISLKSCMNTLSYSMFRSINRRLPTDGGDLAARWTMIRGSTQQMGVERVNQAVLDVCYAHGSDYIAPISSRALNLPSLQPSLLQPDLEFGTPPDSQVARILSDPDLSRKPREDLVRLIDGMLRESAGTRQSSTSDQLLIAKLIFQTTRGLSNQLALMGDAVRRNPEIVMFLGLLQGSVPGPEVLSSFNGVGWKLLSRLSEPFDVFKRPDCDVSFEEAGFYGTDFRNTELGANGKFRVEISWGTSIESFSEMEIPRETERERYSRDQRGKHRQAIELLELRLAEALDITKRMKEEERRRR